MQHQTHGRSGRCRPTLLLLPLAFTLLLGCVSHNVEDLTLSYPEEVGAIMKQRCAIAGCHNAQSAAAAAGLNLETWEDLFKGSRGGSAVVPYSPSMSFLLYSINTDSLRGPTLSPTMPVGSTPLTDAEYELLRNWIEEGARNFKGEEHFPPQSSRRKWYIGNHGCDLVAVFDAASLQIMRYITVGTSSTVEEQVYAIKVSPDQRHWFAVMSSYGDRLEMYSTLTDAKEADIPLGHYGTTGLALSEDGRWAFVVSEFLSQIDVVDLVARAKVGSFALTQSLGAPAIHPLQPRLYLPQSQRQKLYAMDFDSAGALGTAAEIDLVQGVLPAVPGNLWPNDICFLPDGSRYFVSCLHSGEVRAYDGITDSLLQVIPVGASAARMALDEDTGQLFVACMDDSTMLGQAPHERGSVAVIDVHSLQRIRNIYTGFQPYAIAMDKVDGYVVVANRNALPEGPVLHHSNPCGGRSGYVTLIDLQTLTLVPNFKPELSINPLTMAVKQ